MWRDWVFSNQPNLVGLKNCQPIICVDWVYVSFLIKTWTSSILNFNTFFNKWLQFTENVSIIFQSFEHNKNNSQNNKIN